jgi:hypothetical protein
MNPIMDTLSMAVLLDAKAAVLAILKEEQHDDYCAAAFKLLDRVQQDMKPGTTRLDTVRVAITVLTNLEAKTGQDYSAQVMVCMAFAVDWITTRDGETPDA